jgi:hypothetical protein
MTALVEVMAQVGAALLARMSLTKPRDEAAVRAGCLRSARDVTLGADR